MSIALTLFVPSQHRKWTSRALSAEIRRNGFELALQSFDAQKHGGAIPGKYRGLDCHFEYYRNSMDDYLESVEEMREFEPDDFPYTDDDLRRIQSHDHVVQLVTHSRFRGRVAAVITAASLATLTGGWILDEPVWKWHSGSDAIAWARASERVMAKDVAAED